MRKLCVVLIGLMSVIQAAFAAVTISTSSKTFQKQGGAASVTVSGDGAWTAKSDSNWLVIGSGASGNGDGKCLYTCNANNTADTRIGHITIGGNTYTVTQYGYVASISPTTATFDRKGGKGTVSITVDAGVTWTAKSNDDWLSVEPVSGMSVGTVTYTVAEYPGVTTRVGSLTVAGQTFTVTQNGVDVNIDPEVARKDSNANIVSVDITALAQTKWEVTPNAPWITVIDKESGYGDYKLMLALAANPSFERRTATVSIGSATLTVVQDGLLAASLSINPPEATASASGAYGNIAVYATPDAPWTAESLSSWITISEGEEGAGNGNIKYVASANPNLAEREGRIKITPPYKAADFDLCAGLVGSPISSASFDPITCTYLIQFAVGELNCINRLVQYGPVSIWVDIDNRLCVQDYKTDFVIDQISSSSGISSYSLLVHCSKDKKMTVYAGVGDAVNTPSAELDKIYEKENCGYAGEAVRTGYADYPTSGVLKGGTCSVERKWYRALTETESRKALSKIEILNGNAQYPLDCNLYSTRNSCAGEATTGSGGGYAYDYMIQWSNVAATRNRFGIDYRAIAMGATSYVDLPYLHPNSSASSAWNGLTISFWIKFNVWPNADVIKSLVGKSTSTYSCVTFPDEETVKVGTHDFHSKSIQLNQWFRFSLVCSSGLTSVYVNNEEIGNYSSAFFACPIKVGSFGDLRIGYFDGALDDLNYYTFAQTSAKVRECYESEKAQIIYHTVKQGMQYPQLSETAQTAPAEGATRSVNLTLAQLVNWDAKSNTSWIKLTGDTAGAGSARIDYEVEPNPTVIPRTGSITIAGLTVTVTQEGLWADVSSEDTSFGVDSDSGYLWVDTEGAGQWTAVSDADWISIWPGYESGNGAGPVMFIVDDYDNTTQSRSGTITVAGKKVVITQQGYELSIDPQVADLGSNAGAGQFGVAAPIDAVWEAIADCDWITIVGARTGIGDGTIQYTVTDNLTGETRVGRIVIGGKTYTITQRTTLPLTTQVVGKGSVTGAGNYNQGTKVTLKATAANGYVFSHWSGDAVGNDDSVEITVDIEKNVTATFIPEAAAQKLAEQKAAQGGFYTRDQIHALEMGNLVFDVDASGTARVGVQLMETSDLTDPNSWKPATLNGNPDVGQDGTVGMKVKAEGKAKFFKVVMPAQQ